MSTITTNETNKFYTLHCVINSKCNPPCDLCWSDVIFAWYRNDKQLNETSSVSGIDLSNNGEILRITYPSDSLKYYCQTSFEDNALLRSNNFWCK